MVEVFGVIICFQIELCLELGLDHKVKVNKNIKHFGFFLVNIPIFGYDHQ